MIDIRPITPLTGRQDVEITGLEALAVNQEMLKKVFAIILFYTAFKMLGWDAALVKWVKGIF